MDFRIAEPTAEAAITVSGRRKIGPTPRDRRPSVTLPTRVSHFVAQGKVKTIVGLPRGTKPLAFSSLRS